MEDSCEALETALEAISNIKKVKQFANCVPPDEFDVNTLGSGDIMGLGAIGNLMTNIVERTVVQENKKVIKQYLEDKGLTPIMTIDGMDVDGFSDPKTGNWYF